DALSFAPRRYASEVAVQLAEKLAAIAPGGLSKVLFTTGGSDAVEVAVKLARAATGRFKTLSFWDAFHGAGIGASALSGEALFRAGPVAPLVAGAQHVAPFACYRCPYGHPVDADGQPILDRCHTACASMVEYVLAREGDVAAVIAEPARAVPYLAPPGYWQSVRAACAHHGALLIFDEIPTGLGKTGRMFACQHDDVAPDILVLGKALGGGILPIAAVLARPELDVAGSWAFGHYTHEKNPVTARAALTTIEIIEDEGLVENAARVGALALARLAAMKRTLPVIGDVRGRGLLIGIELVRSRADKVPDDDLAEVVLYRALDRGLSFKVTMGNVLTLTPPLTVTEAEMTRALDILAEAIAAGADQPA
ncbi:MAG: aminotransferase class III-fold pyridoxal phosphate-dependent enzyme, partial [Acetobacteraceae bacterium]